MTGTRHSLMLLLVVVWLFLLATGATASDSPWSLDGRWMLQGSVGSYRTTATLEIDGLRASGSYAYEHLQGEISLVGVIDRSGSLVMFELDYAAHRTGTFSGTLTKDGFSGHWIDPTAKQEWMVQWEAKAQDIWSGT